MPATVAVDEHGTEEQNAVDADNCNSNAADKSSKPSSPSGKSEHADADADAAEPATGAADKSYKSSEGQYSVSWPRNPILGSSLNCCI